MNLFGKRKTDAAPLHPLDMELGGIIAEAIGAVEDPEVLEHLRLELEAGQRRVADLESFTASEQAASSRSSLMPQRWSITRLGLRACGE